jgi:hypothetical protein
MGGGVSRLSLADENAALRKAMAEMLPYVEHHRSGDPKTDRLLTNVRALLYNPNLKTAKAKE